MAKITLKGDGFNTNGELPEVGSDLPDFELTSSDLQSVSKETYSGNRLILNCFPSIDTPTCALSVSKFNLKAASLNNTKVLCIAQDLPFAMSRFCGAEGIEDVVALSAFRDRDFADRLGLNIVDGPLKGLFARAIIVTDESGKVTYTQLVTEIAEEPDYDAAIAAL